MQVIGSPFKVMKILSEGFGYSVPVCPIEGDLSFLFIKRIHNKESLGQVQGDVGEKRTCIFTIQN